MNSIATARVTLPGNKTNSVPDLSIYDDDGMRQTLWDFTDLAPEQQTLQGAEDMLARFGWRAEGWESARAIWQESNHRWTLRIERC